MSIRQHRTRDIVAEDLLAKLLRGEPVASAEAAPGITQPSFPPDARAVIYRPGKSAMTSGRANSCDWVLEFEPRSREFIEPLMGWTGGTDPLRQVRLSFPTRAAAVAYARREGLPFTVHEPQEQRPAQCPAGRMAEAPVHVALPSDPLFFFAWDRPQLVMPDFEAALLDPAGTFASPREAAEHPLLTEAEKRAILQCWLWDAKRIEATADEAPLEGAEPSRLDEVLEALALLERKGGQREDEGGARQAVLEATSGSPCMV
jgi:hypothetical protein